MKRNSKRRCSPLVCFLATSPPYPNGERTGRLHGKYRETSGQKCDRHASEVKRTPQPFHFKTLRGVVDDLPRPVCLSKIHRSQTPVLWPSEFRAHETSKGTSVLKIYCAHGTAIIILTPAHYCRYTSRTASGAAC